MFNLFGFGDPLAKSRKKIKEINALSEEIAALSDTGLKEESLKLKDHAHQGESLDALLPRAFALVREAATRTLGQRHYDVQLLGGITLHEGKITEMMTGEGKTLTSTSPIYLNALTGRGVHVITVNDYLAKRDIVWMGQVYHALGLTVSCLSHESAYIYDPDYKIKKEGDVLIDDERDKTGSFLVQMDYLRPISRRDAYRADITYGTNHEFGFDYLRDNLAYQTPAQVQRDFHFAIIDEVDSILIDEARTPLIISAPDQESSGFYKTFARLVASLEAGVDYEVDEKHKSATITESGINKVEQALGIDNLYGSDNLRLSHYLNESLKAYGLFTRDKDYVVKNGEILIVDQFTGRMLPGRRYSAGLHQALEAKEGVEVKNESRTYAEITIQNYFRLYKKLAGMTGTAQTSAEEFDKVYHLEVVKIPTHRKNIRKDNPDLIYKSKDAKMSAIIEEVKRVNATGQPILIGTVSIEQNEALSLSLSLEGIRHEVLNAKNNEREGAIIAQAGRKGAVTVATNMAGRGVDIILGGNPPDEEESKEVRDAGGLHVIGTERHEARRIDNQLRGRAGRQGDPGSSQFFLSLEDDVLRIFGGDKLKNMMTAFNIPEDLPISANLVSRSVEQAQSKIEGLHFDSRKHLLEYDDVINRQRLTVYKKRQELLVGEATAPEALAMLDQFWMTHLENIDALKGSVQLQGYGQKDPLLEFRREAHRLYQTMMTDYESWTEKNKDALITSGLRVKEVRASLAKAQAEGTVTGLVIGAGTDNPEAPGTHSDTLLDFKNVGRNDPCPCGSAKKFKKCHGK